MSQRQWLKAVGVFFLAMALLTLMGRAADTLTIAQVTANPAGSGALTYVIMGQGTVLAAQEQAVWVPEGLRVERVLAQPGSALQAGDALAQLSLDHLIRTLEKQEAQLHKLKNQRAQVKLDKQAQIDALKEDQNEEKARLEKAMQLALQAADLEIGPAQTEVALLAGLMATGGAVVAPQPGIVTQISLKPGETTTQAAAARIAQAEGGLRATFTVDQDQAARIAPGDAAKVTGTGKSQSVEGAVLSVSAPDDQGQCQVQLAVKGGAVGQAVRVELRKKSDNYRRCVPLGALHSDSAGDYLLVVRESSGVLGKTQIASRLPVNVLDRDGERAAVEGALLDEDLVISASDRPIAQGDRVRRLMAP